MPVQQRHASEIVNSIPYAPTPLPTEWSFRLNHDRHTFENIIQSGKAWDVDYAALCRIFHAMGFYDKFRDMAQRGIRVTQSLRLLEDYVFGEFALSAAGKGKFKLTELLDQWFKHSLNTNQKSMLIDRPFRALRYFKVMNIKEPIVIKQEIFYDRNSFVKMGPIEFSMPFISPEGVLMDVPYEIMFRFAIKYQNGQATNQEQEYIRSILIDEDYKELIEKLQPVSLDPEYEEKIENYISIKLPVLK